MSTKDIIHDAIKHALVKDKWIIIAAPFRLRYEDLELFADLAAKRTLVAEKSGRKIIVEVKSFAGRSLVRELQQSLGQYIMYRDVIELTHLDYELYLAISEATYRDFFTQKAIQVIVRRHNLNLLVVNMHTEEVVKWIEAHTIKS